MARHSGKRFEHGTPSLRRAWAAVVATAVVGVSGTVLLPRPAEALTSVTPPVGVNPVPAANNPLPQRCGIDLTIVLDASNSIDNAGQVGTMRTATKGFIDALKDTGSRVNLVQFGSAASAIPVGGATGLVTVTSANLADFNAAIDLVYYSARSLNGREQRTFELSSQTATNAQRNSGTNWGDVETDSGATNYDNALDLVNDPGYERGELVVFVTDGVPTAIDANKPDPLVNLNGDGGRRGGNTANAQNRILTYNGTPTDASGNHHDIEWINRSVEEANALKATGARVLALGIGAAASPGAQSTLAAVAGPNVETDLGLVTAATIGQIDVIVNDNIAALASVFGAVASAFCDASIEVTKEIPGAEPGTWVADGGWTFEATGTASGGTASWIVPAPVAPVATPRQVVTDPATGKGLFQFRTSSPSTTVSVSLNELANPGRPGWVVESVECTRTRSGVSTPLLSATTPGPWALSGMQAKDTVACRVRNTPPSAATVTITKSTAGVPGGPFTVTLTRDGSPVNGDADTFDTLASTADVPASRSYTVTPGSGFAVAEAAPGSPFFLESITCTKAGLPVTPGSFSAGNGETVDCVVTNRARPYRVDVSPDAVNPASASTHTFFVDVFTDTATPPAAPVDDPAAGATVQLAWSGPAGTGISTVNGAAVPGAPVTSTSCTTSATGRCTVVVTTGGAAAGQLTATYDLPYAEATPGSAPSPDPSTTGVPVGANADVIRDSGSKTWRAFRVGVTPPADTNVLPGGENHDFTITAEQSDGAAWGPVPDGTTVTFSWSGAGSVTLPSPGATSCTTTAGACTARVRSTVTGSGTLTVTGVGPVALAGFGPFTYVPQPAVTATKQWVQLDASITGNADNPVGVAHTFTVTLRRGVDGQPLSPFAGARPTFTVTPAGALDATASTCDDPSGADAQGQCTVVVNSAAPGPVTVAVTGLEGLAFPNLASHTFAVPPSATKTFVAYRVTGNATATNRVGDAHTFTFLVEQQRTAAGPWTPAPVGTKVGVTTAGTGSVTGGTCLAAGAGTDGTGRCTVVVNSASPGSLSVTAASVVVALPNGSAAAPTTTTHTVVLAGDAATRTQTKTWVRFLATVTPGSDVNKVGDAHTFVVRLTVEDGQGSPDAAPVPDGSKVDVTWTGPAGSSITSDTCAADGVGTVGGACTVVVNSSNPGTGTLAVLDTGSVSLGGTTFTNLAIEQNPTATKTYVRYLVDVTPDATNPVGEAHTFTVTVRVEDGVLASGVDAAPVENASVVFAVNPVGAFQPAASTCDDPAGTNAAGQCTVVVNNPTPGPVTVTVSSVSATYTQDQRSYPFVVATNVVRTKTFRAFRATVDPLTATNRVTEPHTFTLTPQFDDGAGWTTLPAGTTMTFTWSGAGSVQTVNGVAPVGGQPYSCTTTAGNGGTCKVVVNSPAPGSGTIRVLTIGGLSIPGYDRGQAFSFDIPTADEPTGTKTWDLFDLAVSKTDGGGVYTAGSTETVTYTITVSNVGSLDATDDIVVIDALPPELAWKLASGAFVDDASTPAVDEATMCSVDGQVARCVVPTDLPAGQSFELKLPALVRAETPAGTYRNVVTVDTPLDPCPSRGEDGTCPIPPDPCPEPDDTNNRACDTTTTDREAEVTVAKTDGGAEPLVGDPFTYTLTVSKSGLSTATDVVVTDAVPAGVRITALSAPSGWSCTSIPAGPGLVGPATITCTYVGGSPAGHLSTPTSVITLTAVAASIPQGPDGPLPFRNVARSTNAECTTDRDAGTAGIQCGYDDEDTPARALSIVKNDGGVDDAVDVTAVAGGTVTYTLTVANTGSANLRNVTLTDDLTGAGVFDLSAGVDVDPEAACTVVDGLVTCELGGLDVGASATVTITATVLPGASVTSFTNAASVSDGPGEGLVPATATDDETTALERLVDLGIVKSDADGHFSDPTTAADSSAGIPFTFTVRNDGPGDAVDVVVTDDLAGELAVVEGTLPDGSSSPWTCEYTGADAGGFGGVLTCALPSLAADTSSAFTVDLRLEPGFSTGLTDAELVDLTVLNSATVTSESRELEGPGTLPNTDDETTPVRVIRASGTSECAADTPLLGFRVVANFAPGNGATVRFQSDPANPVTGEDVSYTFGDASSWVEAGGLWTFAPAAVDATGVGADSPTEWIRVVDGRVVVLWPGAAVDGSLVPTDWPGWREDPPGTWTPVTDDLGAGLRPAAVVSISVNPTAEAFTLYPPPTPNCSTDPPATLVVEKVGPAGTYPFTLENLAPEGADTSSELVVPAGSTTSPAVTFEGLATRYFSEAVERILPVQYELREPTPEGFKAPRIECSDETSSADGAVRLTFEPGETIRCTVHNDRLVDLRVDKRILPTKPASIEAGGSVAWTLEVTNLGGTPTEDALVVDHLPAPLAYVTAAGRLPDDAATSFDESSCAVTGQVLTCTLPASVVEPGDPAVTITVPVSVPFGAFGSYENVVAVDSPEDPFCELVGGCATPPPCPVTVPVGEPELADSVTVDDRFTNNVACDTIAVTAGPVSLAVEKAVARSPQFQTPGDFFDSVGYAVGTTATYRFTLHNNGRTPITNVTLVDNLVYGSSETAPAAATPDESSLVACRLAPAGSAGGPSSSDVALAAPVFGSPIAGLTLQPRERRYVFCDLPIPASLPTDNAIFNRFTASGSSRSGDVAVTSNLTIVTLLDKPYDAFPIKNVTDADGSNPRKQLPYGTVTSGRVATFRMTVDNVSDRPLDFTLYDYYENTSPGLTAAQRRAIFDSMRCIDYDDTSAYPTFPTLDAVVAAGTPEFFTQGPREVTFGPGSDGGGAGTFYARSRALGVLPPGDGYEVVCFATLPAGSYDLTNVFRMVANPAVQAAGGVGEVVAGAEVAPAGAIDLTAEAGVDLGVPAELATDVQILKDVSAGVLVPGQTMTYTLAVRNNGPGDATDVVVADANRPGFTLRSASGGAFRCTDTGSGFTCSLPFLAAGAQETITITAQVDAGATNGQVLDNIGTVSTGTPDSNPSNNTDNAASTVTLGDLPRTGASVGGWVGVGVLLLLGGSVGLLVSRRRRGVHAG